MVIVEESKICVFNSLPQKSCCRLDSSSQDCPIAASTSFHKPWGFCRNWKKPGTGSFLQIWLRWPGQCVRSRPERTIIDIKHLTKSFPQDTLVISGCIFSGNCHHKSHLELVPLFAKIDSDIRASNGQVGAAAVEAKIPHLRTHENFGQKRVWTQVVRLLNWRHLIALVHLEGLEVLQFSQIPELHAIVISRRGKVVTLQTKGLNQIKAFSFL